MWKSKFDLDTLHMVRVQLYVKQLKTCHKTFVLQFMLCCHNFSKLEVTGVIEDLKTENSKVLEKFQAMHFMAPGFNFMPS